MSTTGRFKALLMAIAALGVVLVGLASSASAASPSLPDPTKTGSINIHKFKAPDSPTGLPNNGTVQDTTGLTPVPGVTFSIQKVGGIDLTTNQGWQDASALSGVFNPANASGSITGAGYTLTAASGSPVTTNASGDASLAGLPLGLYLVTETAYPTGTTPSAPFLVSVPLTNPADQSTWLYDVNVYPKNSIDNVSKTVEDANAVKLGDPVTWTIKGDIPNVKTIDGYKIVDQLDPKLDYVGTTVTLADGTAITQGTDYDVVFDSATNTVTVQFTAAGRLVLAAHPATQVVVKIDTKVNAVGEIVNTALLYPNAASFNVQPGNPGGPPVTPPVITKWGSMTVQKVDENGAALSGAQFSVYPTEADAKAGTNAITLGGQTVFAVDANGQVTISGLRYSDWANGVAVAPGDAGYQTYWLAEVKAPTGYELLAQPVEFTITAATTTVGVDMTVKDVPANAGFQLPLTGGKGIWLYYIGGALLLGAALVLSIRRRQNA
ncbi:SpaH/EbpB family LPXTG-anchored major pilin [Nocardioides kongjuensis]|nr:SpaH/EbpB family LPXTG-anchored major pilin [Nocardioides kongjuensis]